MSKQSKRTEWIENRKIGIIMSKQSKRTEWIETSLIIQNL